MQCRTTTRSAYAMASDANSIALTDGTGATAVWFRERDGAAREN